MGGTGEAAFKHTPWDGSHPAFRIGLNPLDLQDWIEADARLEFYLEEKTRLAALHGTKVFQAEPGAAIAQAEVLDLLVEHLPRRFPTIYRRDGNAMIINARRVVSLADPALQPLEIAASLVQEDLALMHRDAEGWRLTAASLMFPSSWSLREKFGKPLDQIHAPVPGFGPGSRNAGLMARIFDNLDAGQPVWRLNWSVYSDGQLYHGDRTSEHAAKKNVAAAADLFLRVEYQTLRKLEKCGDILFTIRIHADPLGALARHPDRRRLAAGLAASLARLDPEQLAYKGMTASRDRLVGEIGRIAEG